jgi:hemerythrin-like domain-containing protein
MGNDISITKLMVHDHNELFELISKFRMDLPRLFIDRDKVLEKLKQFYNIQKLHVQIEEKLVFSYIKDKSKFPTFGEIKKQHVIVMKLLNSILNLFNKNKDCNPDSIELQELLKKHTLLEEKTFYPVLDKLLSAKQKEELLKLIENAKKESCNLNLV